MVKKAYSHQTQLELKEWAAKAKEERTLEQSDWPCWLMLALAGLLILACVYLIVNRNYQTWFGEEEEVLEPEPLPLDHWQVDNLVGPSPRLPGEN